jgi:hypothetical protein
MDLIKLKKLNLEWIELGVVEFVEFLNNPEEIFLDYNKYSLYLLRNSSYCRAKLLFG